MIVGTDIDRTLEITDEPVLDAERFSTMVEALPKGDFYIKGGFVIPKRNGPYTLKFTAADAPSRNFNVFINGVSTRTITTNGSGIIEFLETLIAGEGSGTTTVEIRDTVDPGRVLLSYLTLTNYGLLQAAIAAVTQEVDADITDVEEDTSLATVDVADIEQKFGLRIGTQKAANWGLDTYREVLGELYQAYDIFSGTERGLEQVVGALTQIPPFAYRQNIFGPRWVLGFQYLRNNEFAFDTDTDGIPDDWFIETAGTVMVIDTVGAGLTNLFADQRLKVTAAGVSPEAVFSIALPIFRQYAGFVFTFSAWVESTGAFSIVVGISDDGGSTWTESGSVVTTTSPQFLSITKLVDLAAPDLRVRVRQVGSGAGNIWFIERTALFVQGVTGLYLGDATIPRSVRRSVLGETMLWWSPDTLTTEELDLFGLTDFISAVQGNPSPVGHVEFVVPGHVVVKDREITNRAINPSPTLDGLKVVYVHPAATAGTAVLDWDTTLNELSWRDPGEGGFGTAVAITESGSFVLNNVAGTPAVVVAVDFAKLDPEASTTQNWDIVPTIAGTIESADFTAGLTKINLDIITRTPDRFSYLKPALISEQVETLQFDSITSEAPLAVDSTQDQLKALMLVDGLSLPADQWSFVDATTVDVVSLDLNAVYQFTYEALMEFETDVIDLGVNWQSFAWIFDSYVFERFEKNVVLLSETQELRFNRDTFQANLRFRSDEDQEASELVQILSGIETIVSATQWSYVDALTVQISGTQFNANATYILTYTAEKLKRDLVPRLEFELASSVDGIGFGSFASVNRGDFIDTTDRYHKIKVRAFDVVDIGDLRIKSLILKGFSFVVDSPGL